MRIDSRNINYKKIFILLYIIAIVIIIFVVWKPNIKSNIEKYSKLNEQEIDTLASEKYINKFLASISDKNIDYLYDKLSKEYITYNQLTKEMFNDIFENEIYSNNLYVSIVEKYDYNDIKIYRVVLSNKNVINIIEQYGNLWEWTMDDFYSFKITDYSISVDNIEITIDSVLQNMDKLKITCYVENNTDKILDMNLENIDSVMLQFSDNTIERVSNAQIDNSLSIIGPKSMSSRTFIFDIDITNQADIEKIILDNLEINNKETSATINVAF